MISDVAPSPDRDAGSFQTAALLGALGRLGYDLEFVPSLTLSASRAQQSTLEAAGARTVVFPELLSVRRWLRRNLGRFDLVLLIGGTIAHRYLPTVERTCPGVPVLFDPKDLSHLRLSRQASLLGDARLAREARALEQIEGAVFERASLSILLSTTGKELVERKWPDARVETLPLLMEARPLATPFAERSGILFIGGFGHAPNTDAMLHFARELWPALQSRLPGVQLHVIGSDPPRALRKMESEHLRLLGFVPDLEPLLASARLSIAPLRFGAGVKGKVLLSLAHGLPCVVSPIALEGSGLAAGREVLLGETDGAFIDAVSRLYTDEALWSRLAANGLAFIEAECSERALRPRLEAIVARLRADRATNAPG